MEATQLSYAFKSLHNQLNCLPAFSRESILPDIAKINLEVFKLLHLLPDTPTNILAKREAAHILQNNVISPEITTNLDLDTFAKQHILDVIINIQAAVEVLLDGDDSVWMGSFPYFIQE